MPFCECVDFKSVCRDHPDLFCWDDSYNWVIHWVELTKERGYVQKHNYGIPIEYCPFCGSKLRSELWTR